MTMSPRRSSGWRARGGQSLEDIVNEALRVGLARLESDKPATAGPFTHPVPLGRPVPPVDDVSEALAVAEGDDNR